MARSGRWTWRFHILSSWSTGERVVAGGDLNAALAMDDHPDPRFHGNDRLFAGLCRVLGHPEWASDPRFGGNQERAANLAALNGLLQPVLVLPGLPVVARRRRQSPSSCSGVLSWSAVAGSHTCRLAALRAAKIWSRQVVAARQFSAAFATGRI